MFRQPSQAEAAYALGLRKFDVLRVVQLPQAIRYMLPVLVAQLVVLLKDSALGYVIGYVELLRQAGQIGTEFNNVVQAAILIAAIYIVINLILGMLATQLERRLGRAGQRAPQLGPAAEMGGGGAAPAPTDPIPSRVG